jgi:hypothetical protein
MQRKSSDRDVVARVAYRPPAPAAARPGGRRVVMRLASVGVLVGVTIVAGVAVLGASRPAPIEVTYEAPPVPAAAVSELVIDRDPRRVTLRTGDELAWRGQGPIDCVSGRPWADLRDHAALLARACVRLRDGAVVGLSGRVPPGATVRVR